MSAIASFIPIIMHAALVLPPLIRSGKMRGVGEPHVGSAIQLRRSGETAGPGIAAHATGAGDVMGDLGIATDVVAKTRVRLDQRPRCDFLLRALRASRALARSAARS